MSGCATRGRRARARRRAMTSWSAEDAVIARMAGGGRTGESLYKLACVVSLQRRWLSAAKRAIEASWCA